MTFALHSALQASQEGSLEPWIQSYLRTGDWMNPGLADGLLLAPRWWKGPLEVETATLKRCCGPEPDMEYRINSEAWEEKVHRIQNSLIKPEDLPPLIVEYRPPLALIRDGSHRFEALSRKGMATCWIVVWHNSEEDFNNSSW